jgi:hypothetical protein
MLSQQNMLQIAKQWLEDWNAHDLEAIMSHYAESLEFTSPIIIKLVEIPDGTIRDKAQLRSYFQKGLTVYPDLKFEPINILFGVNSMVLYYRSYRNNSTQFSAEFMGFDAAGLVNKVVAHYSEAEL